MKKRFFSRSSNDDSSSGSMMSPRNGYHSHRSFASSGYGSPASPTTAGGGGDGDGGRPPQPLSQPQRRSLRMSVTIRKPASDIHKCSSCPCPDFCPNPFSPNFCRDCYHSDTAHSNNSSSSSSSSSSSKRRLKPTPPSSPPPRDEHRNSTHITRPTVAINSILATYITNTADQVSPSYDSSQPPPVPPRPSAFSVSSQGKFSLKSQSSKAGADNSNASNGVSFMNVPGRESNISYASSNSSTESYFDRFFRFQRAKSIVLGGVSADGDANAPIRRMSGEDKRDSVIPGKCTECNFISKRTSKFCSNCGVPLAPVPNLPALKDTSQQPPVPPPKTSRSSYPQKKHPHPPPKTRASAPSVASPAPQQATRSPRSVFSRAPATHSPYHNGASTTSTSTGATSSSSSSSSSRHWPNMAYASLSSMHLTGGGAGGGGSSTPSKSAPSSSSKSTENSPKNRRHSQNKYATISSGSYASSHSQNAAAGAGEKSSNDKGDTRSIFKTVFGRSSAKKKNSPPALVTSKSAFNLKSMSAASTPRGSGTLPRQRQGRFGTFSPRKIVKRNQSDERFRVGGGGASSPVGRPHSFSDPEFPWPLATTSSSGSASSPSLRPRSAISSRISNNVFVSMDRASNASDKDQPVSPRSLRKSSSSSTGVSSPRFRSSSSGGKKSQFHHQPHSHSSGVPQSPVLSPRQGSHQPHSQSDVTFTDSSSSDKPLNIGLPTPVIPPKDKDKRPTVPTPGAALSPKAAGDKPRTPRRKPPHPPKMPKPTRPPGFSLASSSSAHSSIVPLSTNASSNSSNASSSSSSSSNASSSNASGAIGGAGGSFVDPRYDGRLSPRHDLSGGHRWSIGEPRDDFLSRPGSSHGRRFLDLQSVDDPMQIMETPEVNELEQRRGMILQELDQYSGAEISDQETWDHVTNLRAELDRIEDRLSPWGDPEDPLLDELFEAFINGSIDPAEIVERAPTESLSIHFLMICNSLLETPMYLEYYKKRVLSVMATRVAEDPYLKQQVTFTRAAGTPDVVNLLAGFEENAQALPVFLKFFVDKRNKGYEVEIPVTSVVYHPFKPMRLRKIRVEKVFNSNSRPLLLKLYGQSRPELVIFKAGDDLRQDMACMAIFRLLNQIWESEQHINHSCALEARVYDCLALSPNFGAIEYLPNCMSLFELGEKKPTFDAAQQARLVATGAGSYMASWLLGIKDRHDDNTLISEDGTIFHIDFGYILGEKVSVDTADFAITKDLKNALGQHGWVSFTSNCVKAYVLLRKHHQTIIRFAAMMLGPLYTHDRVVEYLSKSLLLDMSLSDAILHINTLIKKAPNSYRTRIKNALHHRAQQYKERKFEEANKEAELHDWNDVVKTPVS